ncbi:probable galacturonosyltransferase 6 [Hibiscus syriacus]|uniref:probable galacturonosyltransferase 6 n=1 Tax=Hibiscus syriacus TaxID=106335 RepID=UPI0019223390|nr:probable galacturonosyltransferase 6 [Hibiscus syriacus]
MENQVKNLFKLFFSHFYRLMKKKRWRQRILILCLLSFSLFAPMVLLSQKLKPLNSIGQDEFNEDFASVKYKTDYLRLNAIEQKASEELKGRKIIVLNEKDHSSSVASHSSDENRDSNQYRDAQHASKSSKANDSEIKGKGEDRLRIQQKEVPRRSRKQEQFNREAGTHNQHLRTQSRSVTNKRLKQMNEQLIRAKAYLSLGRPGSYPELERELRRKIKQVERAVRKASNDSDLPRSSSRMIRSMEVWLAKMNHTFADCFGADKTLCATVNDTEEQVQAEKNQGSYLVQLAGRTTPKGLHCLSMRLTAEYFLLQPEERQFPNQHKLHDLDLYHYAVFSDEILACAVVVNSTTASAKEPEKIVFHILTDSLNLPAISMWFLLNPPGGATIHVQSIENFNWLSTEYYSTLKEYKSDDPRYTSTLSHLRFYLADIFPSVDKIVLFDHDVVVQRDLTALWTVDMKRKVHAAVETCRESKASFHSMNLFMNISDQSLAKRFNSSVCTWAFGMNLFDLKEWRRQNLTMLYHNYLQLGLNWPLSEAGRLPLGWITFYNQTVALDKRWHSLGLGYNPGLRRDNIKNAAVIHYDGIRKPWLEIGIAEYKGYWSKHLQYEHPYLQQCNIHE